jgi:peptide methionine sulfoxide reductase msrA/msrB
MGKSINNKIISLSLVTILGIVSIAGCSNSQSNQTTISKPTPAVGTPQSDSTAVIYFAGGCFWGTEHFFKQVKGVVTTEVGFANGHTENPTYKEVIRKETGYAETVKVTYDPQQVDFKLLLDLYFLTIDPTSVNKQGNDVGDQYRTGIYYTTDQQLPLIKERIRIESAKYAEKVVVEVVPLEKYHRAEDYHQNYLEKNPGGYCHINPALFKIAREANSEKK